MEKLINDFVEKINPKFICKYQKYEHEDGYVNGGFFKVYDEKDNEVTTFILQQMSGCSGICISNKVAISDAYRGNGYGVLFCELREAIAVKLRYAVIMCTVVLGNHPQQKIMKKRGWEITGSFLNLKTGNQVSIYMKKLNQS
jgi:hypothetical protein